MLDETTKKYFDEMPDNVFVYILCTNFSITIPIWERCTKEEYEEHTSNRKPLTDKLTLQDIYDAVAEVSGLTEYRRVPIWHNGGGILDRMSGKEPNDYYYEKKVGTQKVLTLGGDMIEYCKTRECMKPYFDKQTIKQNENN